MIALEEPEYSDACWEGDRGCAFPVSIVNVAVSKEFAEAASQEMLDFIDAYSIDGDLMSGLLAFMQANDAEAAIEFLQSRTDLWTTWVSAVADAPGNGEGALRPSHSAPPGEAELACHRGVGCSGRGRQGVSEAVVGVVGHHAE